MIRLAPLARYVTAPPVRSEAERCELCAAVLAPEHRHVVDLERKGLHCACHACAILFVRTSTSSGRFRTVPERTVIDPQFSLTTAAWTALGVPVGLAFVFHSTPLGGPVLCYPGPAGITEAEAPARIWEALLDASTIASMLEPDVEALLVHGERGVSHLGCYLIPIDTAYALAGRLRRCWRGFSGGAEAEHEIAAFFAEITERAR